MKKQLLPALISISLFTLIACDDKPDADSANKAGEKAAEQVVKTAVDPATQAETTFKTLVEGSQTYYQTMFGSAHPMIKSITYQIDSYEKGDDTSTAVTKGTVTLNTSIEGKSSFDLLFKHNIKHDAATIANGLIASIDSRVQKPAESNPNIDKVIENLNMTTDVKVDGQVNHQMLLQSLSIVDGDDNMLINGLDLQSQTTLKNMAGGFGNTTLNFKGATFSDGSEKLTVEPFNFSGEYKPSGEFSFKSATPFVMRTDELTFNIADMSGNGTMLHNKKFDVWLGKQSYQLNNIQVTSPVLPMPITIETTTVGVDTAISDKDILSQTANISLTPADGLVNMLSQGMVDISKASINYQLDNIPATLLSEYQHMMSEVYSNLDSTDSEEEMEKRMAGMKTRFKTMFDSAKAQGSNMALTLNLTAAEGPVTLDANANMRADSTVTFEQLENLESSPALLFDLLAVNANASIPALLLEKTGMQMMTGPFLQKNGDVYQAKVTTEAGQLLINGMPAPL
ncbi:MAG: hypothetical protein CR975_01305 [Gammaproteobacteria bacterium]|nr:MAG: hypothetical protein CR975_01305 [Gammaproteobacteria bacterium]